MPLGTFTFAMLSPCLLLPWGSLQWNPMTSSTARRWAPTVAQCPAFLSACEARGKPGLDPCSRWMCRRSDRNSAPSLGLFQWPPSAPLAVHRKKEISLRSRTGETFNFSTLQWVPLVFFPLRPAGCVVVPGKEERWRSHRAWGWMILAPAMTERRKNRSIQVYKMKEKRDQQREKAGLRLD